MNYYILPKNNLNINIFLSLSYEAIIPYVSYSLIYHLNDTYNNLLRLEEKLDNNNELNNITIEYIDKIVNPFEFIHTNVPGSCLSVSKVKPSSNIFFELMEVFQVCNITDILSLKKQINIAHLTSNNSSTIDLLNMLREDNDDTIINLEFDYKTLYNTFIETPI